MVITLLTAALLLSVFGCMLPLSWLGDTRSLKVGAFLLWSALIVVSVLMRTLYPQELTGLNPLLTVGLEAVCIVCAVYPAHGFTSYLADGTVLREGLELVLVFTDLLVTVVGYICLLLGIIWLIFF